MMKGRWIFVLAIVFVAVVFLAYFFFGFAKNQKPLLLGLYLQDPDFLDTNASYNNSYWKPYHNQGFYLPSNFTIDGRNGIFIIHPISRNVNGLIEQNAFLPSGRSLKLYTGIADIAGKVNFPSRVDFSASRCDDVGFYIKIIDLNSGYEKILDNVVVNAKQGWLDLSYDISEFAGKNVAVRIESYDGGQCHNFTTEWAAVDYVDIH